TPASATRTESTRPLSDMMVPHGVGEFLPLCATKPSGRGKMAPRPPPRSKAPGVLHVFDVQLSVRRERDAAEIEAEGGAGGPAPADPGVSGCSEDAEVGEGDRLRRTAVAGGGAAVHPPGG